MGEGNSSVVWHTKPASKSRPLNRAAHVVRAASQDSWSVQERMDCLDLSASAASRSVLDEVPKSFAALLKLSHGSAVLGRLEHRDAII
jgi:hypothetical protein